MRRILWAGPASALIIFIFSASTPTPRAADNLEKIKLPPGFHIEMYVPNIPNARAMSLAPNGTLFVGTREKGVIYAVTKERKVITLDKGLNMPAGVDFHDGDLYVSSVSTIYKYPDILDHLSSPPKRVVVTDQYPDDKWHGWKFIRFGPDGKLYVPVGAPCNICMSDDPVFATITRISKDGTGLEIIAHGVRNTVGFDWDPETGNLWFTDNGRDYMGDDQPPDELDELTKDGQHFGFPFVHGFDTKDPEFWDKRPSGFQYEKPKVDLQAHTAALGMRFYTGKMFPEKYRGGIFIAEHGSWNRSHKIGYRVVYVPVKNGVAGSQEIFAQGWLQGENAWGRPVDVLVMPDGALLVSDDFAGKIYRIYYK